MTTVSLDLTRIPLQRGGYMDSQEFVRLAANRCGRAKYEVTEMQRPVNRDSFDWFVFRRILFRGRPQTYWALCSLSGREVRVTKGIIEPLLFERAKQAALSVKQLIKEEQKDII